MLGTEFLTDFLRFFEGVVQFALEERKKGVRRMFPQEAFKFFLKIRMDFKRLISRLAILLQTQKPSLAAIHGTCRKSPYAGLHIELLDFK